MDIFKQAERVQHLVGSGILEGLFQLFEWRYNVICGHRNILEFAPNVSCLLKPMLLPKIGVCSLMGDLSFCIVRQVVGALNSFIYAHILQAQKKKKSCSGNSSSSWREIESKILQKQSSDA